MVFTVYSKDGCPFCTKVQQVLKLAKLEHVVYKLEETLIEMNFMISLVREVTSQEY